MNNVVTITLYGTEVFENIVIETGCSDNTDTRDSKEDKSLGEHLEGKVKRSERYFKRKEKVNCKRLLDCLLFLFEKMIAINHSFYIIF